MKATFQAMHGSVLTIRNLEGDMIRLQVDDELFVSPGSGIGPEADLSEYFGIAGLADSHAHLAVDDLTQVANGGVIEQSRQRAFAHLAKGVFLVIDKGWRDDVTLSLLNDPPTDRPHLQAAGRLITSFDGYFPGFAEETDEHGLVAAIAAADVAGGWVKLVGDWPRSGRGPVVNFGEEALALACNIAHKAGARVAIHTMAPETPSLAVRAGVDSIEHGLFLTEDDIALLGSRGGAWVPTIGNVLDVAAALRPGSTGATMLGSGLENILRMLPLAPEAGVVVLAGTDLGLPHGAIAEEAALLRAYGLSNRAAVSAAGESAYRYLGIPALEPGSSADLVLFKNNPSENVEELRRPVAGMRAGKVIFDSVRALGPDRVQPRS